MTAAVRVDQIAYGQWPPGTDDRPSTALAPRVSVVRRAALGRPSVPRFWDLTVRFDLMIDDEGLEESVEMTCPAGSVLTLRSFSRSRRLLDCDPAHAARDWYRTADPAYRLIPSVARNPPSRVVRRADVLGVAAPPRAWVPLGLGGLLVAGWLLRRARRRDAAPAPLLASPYRALAAPVTGAVDGDREDLLRAAALAVAVHAAAPLVLLPWMTFARG